MAEKPGWITASMIWHSRNTVYVFGDNLERRGLGGQARVARKAKFLRYNKTFGIPTKRSPGRAKSDYFSDREDEIKAVKESFDGIRKLKKKGRKIVFFPGIGDGLAKLRIFSPLIHSMIQDFIAENETVNFDRMRGLA